MYVALNCPKGPWPVPTATSLFVISLIVVAAVELLPRILVEIFVDVTSTVRARTEVLTVELQLDPTYRWWLPSGNYALITAASAVGCEHRSRLDLACDYAQATSVTIKNGASVRFEITTVPGAEAPSFMLALTPRADNSEGRKSSFEIRDSADKVLVETSDLVTFASQPVTQWRIPLLVERVQIGESLSDFVAAEEALGTTTRQPIMTEGDVRMFARAFWFDERYQIKEERFDPADIVQIPADDGAQGLLVGLLSLDSAAQREFDVTVHTELADVFVRRLGAGHIVGVSMWAVASKLPMWLALWVVWVSLILIANYYTGRPGKIAGARDDD